MAALSRKTALEEELQKLDREIETTEREMTKLSFLAPQVLYFDAYKSVSYNDCVNGVICFW
jgi:hypothetical protein